MKQLVIYFYGSLHSSLSSSKLKMKTIFWNCYWRNFLISGAALRNLGGPALSRKGKYLDFCVSFEKMKWFFFSFCSSQFEDDFKSLASCFEQSVWPDGRLFFNIWPFTTMKLCPIAFFAKIGSMYCQTLNKAFEKLPKTLRNFSQNDKISSNLVTLFELSFVTNANAFKRSTFAG